VTNFSVRADDDCHWLIKPTVVSFAVHHWWAKLIKLGVIVLPANTTRQHKYRVCFSSDFKNCLCNALHGKHTVKSCIQWALVYSMQGSFPLLSTGKISLRV